MILFPGETKLLQMHATTLICILEHIHFEREKFSSESFWGPIFFKSVMSPNFTWDLPAKSKPKEDIS